MYVDTTYSCFYVSERISIHSFQTRKCDGYDVGVLVTGDKDFLPFQAQSDRGHGERIHQ